MTKKSKRDITYLVKMATSPKSRWWGPGEPDVLYIRATFRGDELQLKLVPHKRLKLSLTGLHSWATNPTQLH